MHKRGLLFAVPAALALAAAVFSCAGPFGMPQGIKIKGSPEFDISLGSYNFILDDVFSPADMQDALGGTGMSIYEWVPDAGKGPTGGLEAKTYLMSYAIDPVTVNLDVDEFGFDLEPIDGAKGKIPEIDNHSTPKIEIPISPGTGGAATGSIPLDDAPIIYLDGVDDPDFIYAQVQDGYLSLWDNYGDDFSAVTVTLKSPGQADQVLMNPIKNNKEYRYDMAGKTIYTGTEIHLGESVAPSSFYPQASSLEIFIESHIARFSSAKVKALPMDPIDPIEIKLDSTKYPGINSVTFSQTGIALALSPRIDELTIRVEADGFGIDGTQITSSANAESGLSFVGAGADSWTLERDTPHEVRITVTPDVNGVTLYGVDGQGFAPGDEVIIEVFPQSLFDWSEAEIFPTQLPEVENLRGFFPGEDEPFDISDLTGSLKEITGDDTELEFSRVGMRLYIDTQESVKQGIELRLKADYKGQERYLAGTVSGFAEINDSPGKAPVFDSEDGVYRGGLETPDFGDFEGNNAMGNGITGIFNAKPSDLILSYEITLGDDPVTIINEEGQKAFSIKPDLIIELPLEFKIPRAAGKEHAVVKLPLSNFMSGDGDTGADLFNRPDPNGGGSGDDTLDIIDQIRSAGFTIKYKNNLINASLYLTQDDAGVSRFEKSIFEKPDGDEELETTLDLNVAGDLKYPFMPNIEIRLPPEPGDPSHGILRVKPDKPGAGGADPVKTGIELLSISANVKTSIDYDITL